MKKTMIILSIVFFSAYVYAHEFTEKNIFALNKYTSSQGLYVGGDTTKNSADSSYSDGNNGGQTDSTTQRVLDSINAARNGYGNFYFYQNRNQAPVRGTREPNSYKSGRTGGQYDPVYKPGMEVGHKKDDDKK